MSGALEGLSLEDHNENSFTSVETSSTPNLFEKRADSAHSGSGDLNNDDRSAFGTLQRLPSLSHSTLSHSTLTPTSSIASTISSGFISSSDVHNGELESWNLVQKSNQR